MRIPSEYKSFEKHFEKQEYNVLTIKSRNSTVLSRWDELTKYPEFNIDYGNHRDVHINTECILRFCLLFYQKNTLNLVQPNFWQRKRICAEMAGLDIDKETNSFSNRVEEMLLGKNKVVNQLIARVLQLSDDINFQEYLTLESVRHRHMTLLLEGVEANSKNSLDLLERVSSRIEIVNNKMLKEDVNTPVKEALYHAVVDADLPTPENIALAKRNNQLDDIVGKGPYEIKYEKIVEGGKRNLK